MPQESVKQMSLCKLPLVLCLHIKRFEHSHVGNMSRKIDRYVRFPFNLDMAPYVSSCIVRQRHGNRLGFIDTGSAGPTEYELYAVVSHSGKLDSGHYLAYLRLGLQWYRCNDSWISRVSADLVRATQAYMLYYVQRGYASHLKER
jgi:ubiquitin carboxyl-terminal hydrolase 22/27/51